MTNTAEIKGIYCLGSDGVTPLIHPPMTGDEEQGSLIENEEQIFTMMINKAVEQTMTRQSSVRSDCAF